MQHTKIKQFLNIKTLAVSMVSHVLNTVSTQNTINHQAHLKAVIKNRNMKYINGKTVSVINLNISRYLTQGIKQQDNKTF